VLQGRTIVLGACGGIAVYKVALLVSRLRELGADVQVIMTEAATKFVTPLTFRTISANPVYVDLFASPPVWNVEHVALAGRAELAVIAPATADIIGKAACGIADDFLSTTLLAMTCPVLFVPSMDADMYAHPAVKRNLTILSGFGHEVMTPDSGRLASGLIGPGRYPETDRIVSACLRLLGPRDLTGTKVVVSAGPTREFLDPVRFISNPSTGRMGFALAAEARRRGAEVSLVTGPTELKPPDEVSIFRVNTALEMRERVLALATTAQVVVMAAAPGDWMPATVAAEKMKKSQTPNLTLTLVPAPDILSELGRRPDAKRPILVGFAAETEDLLSNAKAKLIGKNVDLIVANSVVGGTGSGFAVDSNKVTLLGRDGSIEELPLLRKSDVARAIVDRIVQLMAGGGQGHAGAEPCGRTRSD
jgi:phosphopantothenoylcysteine decarboxylase/phosphopantothenate--cysteine ligase